MAILELQGITKTFGGIKALDAVTIAVKEKYPARDHRTQRLGKTTL